MSDIYVEHMVRRKTPPAVRAVFILSVVMLVVNFALSFVNPLSAVVAFAFLALAWYSRRFLNVEYEYALTNQSLDIDVIYGEERRGHVCTIDLSHAERLVIGERAGLRQQWKKLRDYTSGTDAAGQCGLAVSGAAYEGVEGFVLEPGEAMIDAIRRRAPRLVVEQV